MSDSASRWNRPYYNNEGAGVAFLGCTGIITLVAIIYVIMARKLRKMRKYSKAHLFSHFVMLLFANTLQALGTIANFRWVKLKGVEFGIFCSWQGGIKQLANVSTAFFTFTISLHLFALLFLRINLNRVMFGLFMMFSWCTILMLVLIGPTAIEKDALGPFFGPAGAWCWIRDSYPRSRVLLEYFIEYLSAGFCFILYSIILLRVRGNLYRRDGRWRLRHLAKEEAWQLSIGRDLIDSTMLKVAQSMVWYPVAYTAILVPISAARLPEFLGVEVPFAITIITSIIFNLNGFINVVLLLWTEKYFPDGDAIPTFGTKRKHVSLSMHQTGGLVPFTVDRSEQAEEYEKIRKERLDRMGSQTSHESLSRSGSRGSFDSFDSIRLPPRTHARLPTYHSDNSQTTLLT